MSDGETKGDPESKTKGDNPSFCFSHKILIAVISIVGFLGATTVVLAVVLSLPEVISCWPSDKGYYVKIVDPPLVNESVPALTCVYYGPRNVTLIGQSFISYNNHLPTAFVDDKQLNWTTVDNCTKMKVRGQNVKLCDEMDVELPMRSVVDTHWPNITVINYRPTDPDRGISSQPCMHQTTQVIVEIAPPDITDAFPPAICRGTTHDIDITGEHFLTIYDTPTTVTPTKPTFELLYQSNPTFLVPNPDMKNCVPIFTNFTVERYNELDYCTTATLTIDGDQPEDYIVVKATNPAPADCASIANVDFLVVQPPVITSITPSAICVNDGSVNVTIVGTSFLVVDGVMPTIDLDGSTTATVIDRSGCLTTALMHHVVQTCTTLIVRIEQQTTTVPRHPTLTIIDPNLSDCHTETSTLLAIIAPGVITSTDLTTLCAGVSIPMVATGTFYTFPGDVAEFSFSGSGQVAIASYTGCSSYFTGVDVCTTASMMTPDDLAIGNVEITAPCATTGITLPAVASPVVDIVIPNELCEDLVKSVEIYGTGFQILSGFNPVVKFGGYSVPIVNISDCTTITGGQSCNYMEVTVDTSALPVGPVNISVVNYNSLCTFTGNNLFTVLPFPNITGVNPYEFCYDKDATMEIYGTGFMNRTTAKLIGTRASDYISVEWINDTFMYGRWNANTFPDGWYDVEVSNGPDCTDILLHAVEIQPVVIAVFVDPPVIYNGIPVAVTLYTSGLLDPVFKVEIDCPPFHLEYNTSQVIFNNSNYNIIKFVIPVGVPVGNYSVTVTSRVGCVGFANNVFTVTSTVSLTISSVNPNFVWTGEDTSITVYAPVDSFVPVPRVYLSPTGNGNDSSPVLNVVVRTGLELTGIISKGRTPQMYDLIVVNPDGTVGILSGAITVLPYPPPQISIIIPATVVAQGGIPVTIYGAGLNASHINGYCNMAPTYRPDIFLISTMSPDVITATSNGLSLPVANAVCYIQLINYDGSSCMYYSTVWKGPSAKLSTKVGQPTLQVPRRGLSAFSGHVTNSARYIYAAGGENNTVVGTLGTLQDVVEYSTVDEYGDTAGWATQVDKLPSPRAYASSAVIGRYLYMFGGITSNIGNNANGTTDVIRAQLLNPLEAPKLDLFLSVEIFNASLQPGLWYYQVSANFAPGSACNPSGESLPSEPFSVKLPDIETLQRVLLHLSWNALPEAVSYNVYKTTTAGAGISTICRVAIVSDTFFVDFGNGTCDGKKPLPPGTLGKWHPIATLNTRRFGASAAVMQKGTDEYMAFVFGGLSSLKGAAGTYPNTYEVLDIVVTPPSPAYNSERQSVSVLALGTKTPSANTKFGAFGSSRPFDWRTMKEFNQSQEIVWMGPSRTADGALNTYHKENYLPYGGTDFGHAQFLDTQFSSMNALGYCSYACDSTIFFIGGTTDTAFPATSIAGSLKHYIALQPDLTVPPTEDLSKVSATMAGAGLSVPMAYSGCAYEAGLFYLVGGQLDTGVTSLVYYTV